MTTIQAAVFDLYGTLLEVGSVGRAAAEVTDDPAGLVALWRTKQLEYTWLRSLMGRYADFWVVTEDALRWAITRLGITATEADVQHLMNAYLSLACFPEVASTLATLAGRPRAILSNGAPKMLAAAVSSSGLTPHLDHVLSVDAVKTYKPSPTVYALAPQALGIASSDLLFVSSNGWDVAGAKSFGYQTAWCNRQNAPAENLGVSPDVTVRSLADLPK